MCVHTQCIRVGLHSQTKREETETGQYMLLLVMLLNKDTSVWILFLIDLSLSEQITHLWPAEVGQSSGGHSDYMSLTSFDCKLVSAAVTSFVTAGRIIFFTSVLTLSLPKLTRRQCIDKPFVLSAPQMSSITTLDNHGRKTQACVYRLTWSKCAEANYSGSEQCAC